MYFDNSTIEEKITAYQKSKDRAIIDELVPTFDKLITGVIGKYKLLRKNLINDDLSQEAWVGIIESIDKWDPEKGSAFSFFTAIVKNKIFWYLKNHYQDTSFDAEKIHIMSIDDADFHFEIVDENISYSELAEIRDFIKKLTVEDLRLEDSNGEYEIILDSLKKKFLDDNINYVKLTRETQKEIRIPKKKTREVLDAIYSNYMERHNG